MTTNSKSLPQETNMENTVASRVLKTELINWREAQWFQNEALKQLSPEAMERLKASLQANQFIMPFHVWQEGETIWILDGHHRQLALNQLQAEGVSIPDELPATFIECADSKEAAKFVLIYSSIYAKIQNAGLDEFLKLHEIDLDEFKLELDLPDFSLPRFEQKFQPIDIEGEDEFYDAEADNFSDIVIQHGDLFLLNDHKLYCGDCLNSETWQLLMEGQQADVIFTDPPYNLPAVYIGNKGVTKHDDFAMAKGEMSGQEFMHFLRDVMAQMVKFSRDGAIHYICMDFRHMWHMIEAGRSSETYGAITPKQLCVWNKSNGANGSFYRAKHELIFVYKHGKGKHYSNLELKDRVRYNIWDYPSAGSLANPDRAELKNHPTPKPVSMIKDALLDVSKEGDLVLDFFLGSGSTFIAADYTKRICYGSEIEPKYCQSIIRRYQQHCRKLGKPFRFEHVNGSLTIEDLQLASSPKDG